MGKVIVSQFITIDGVVEDPGGSESRSSTEWRSDADIADATDRRQASR